MRPLTMVNIPPRLPLIKVKKEEEPRVLYTNEVPMDPHGVKP